MTALATHDLQQAPGLDTDLNRDLSTPTLRSAFSHFPSGVAALAGVANGSKEGLVASSFTVGVSLEPALVSFAVQNTSRTWPRLKQAERIGISILGEDHTDVCRQLASKEGDRFAGLDIRSTDEGAIFLDGAALWLDTTVYSELPAGDHTMVLLEVHGVHDHSAEHEPIVFHRSAFRNLRTAEGNQ
ncbi:flavin reductase family protein [Citricoccus sp. K5]|uniref:flavin reductase family protein n=1 Tax=Citricoccus sp. K5 TaxID=2653135 RepID=UPI0012F0968F|nr:flavin reductase family protein [Citricoccus sp. K5]VXB82307.1 Flavin reductase (DIM6/NTAB) family NADH-FMN oxidoreductase RutF [Citricoccus sp. K5]